MQGSPVFNDDGSFGHGSFGPFSESAGGRALDMYNEDEPLGVRGCGTAAGGRTSALMESPDGAMRGTNLMEELTLSEQIAEGEKQHQQAAQQQVQAAVLAAQAQQQQQGDGTGTA